MKMKISVLVIALLGLCTNLTEVNAANSKDTSKENKIEIEEQNGPLMFGKPNGQIFAACDGRVVILNLKGEIIWQHKTACSTDAWMLPNGNVIFGDGKTITEVTPDHKIVFQFKSETGKHDATYACQRLANGNTLVGENATGKVLEVNPQGKVVFELQLLNAKPGNHQNQRMIRKLDNGNYLVCHSGEHIVREYQPSGTVVWEQKVGGLAFAAVRKKNGNTLISSLHKIQEFTPDHKVVWEFKNNEIQDVKITNMTGMHLLENGNLVVGCYASYQKGKGTGIFEITPDKKLVWRFTNPKLSSSNMAVQKLSLDGKVEAIVNR